MAAQRPPGAAGPERLAIVGTGLRGGWLGLASLAEGLVERVVGWDADAGMLRRALERGAITEEAGSIADAVEGASLVVLSMPVGAIPASFQKVAPHLGRGTVVTDLGSAKGRLVQEIEPLVPPGGHLIGGEPTAIPTKAGMQQPHHLSFPQWSL